MDSSLTFSDELAATLNQSLNLSDEIKISVGQTETQSPPTDYDSSSSEYIPDEDGNLSDTVSPLPPSPSRASTPVPAACNRDVVQVLPAKQRSIETIVQQYQLKLISGG